MTEPIPPPHGHIRRIHHHHRHVADALDKLHDAAHTASRDAAAERDAADPNRPRQ